MQYNVNADFRAGKHNKCQVYYTASSIDPVTEQEVHKFENSALVLDIDLSTGKANRIKQVTEKGKKVEVYIPINSLDQLSVHTMDVAFAGLAITETPATMAKVKAAMDKWKNTGVGKLASAEEFASLVGETVGKSASSPAMETKKDSPL